MTDNEIIKALEICCTKGASCKDCPAFVKVDKSNCKKVLLGAIDLITRQKAEIESLKEKNRNAMRCSPKAIRRAKDEAIKEFAESVTYCKDCVNRELMTSNNQHFCNKFGGYVSEKDCCSRGVPCKRNGG